MGIGEYIFKLVAYSLLGGYFLARSARAMDTKEYFIYGVNLMGSIPWIVCLIIASIKVFMK